MKKQSIFLCIFVLLFSVVCMASMYHNGNFVIDGNFTGDQFYAQVTYHNHTPTEINFGTQGVFYNMTFTTKEGAEMNGFITDGTHSITVKKAGLYLTNYYTIGSGQNNHEYVSTIRVNGVTQNFTSSHKKLGAGGDILTMGAGGLVHLSVNDVVTLGVTDIDGTGTGNYYGMSMSLVRVGD